MHYNYGILESKNLNFSWKTIMNDFKLPHGKSALKMASIVLVASTISGILIEKAEKAF